MVDTKSIKVSVSKIDGIEKLVNQINSKVENLETKMKSMDTRVQDVEQVAQRATIAHLRTSFFK